ncbi:unnamed protein product [Mytilus edulis]|uniref:Reverse transcriptase domain-containing protein n=1 Tax=Mytilus edulis TaxID=6550 RepID=A0A8S3URC4_MYTED|nr:unnamed protein product [Mytilus edulis]
METRTKDTKLFHQLVKSNRKTRGNAIMDLHVGDICMSDEQIVMEGFKQHFRNLATPEESTVLENRQYHQQVIILKRINYRDTGSGPANAALPVEEIYREAKDNNQEYELVLLDAKSAFNVVIHSHLMKRLYHAGIDDKHWTIIQTRKSDAINIKPKPTKKETLLEEYTLNEAIMPRVDSAMHLGIIRTNSLKQNIIANIEENIKKSRRSAYALLGSGFHGENEKL